MVRRQVHHPRPKRAGWPAHAEGERPGAGVHEFGGTVGERIADELPDSAAALGRVNGDARLLLQQHKLAFEQLVLSPPRMFESLRRANAKTEGAGPPAHRRSANHDSVPGRRRQVR
jgi:hypothetical protein